MVLHSSMPVVSLYVCLLLLGRYCTLLLLFFHYYYFIEKVENRKFTAGIPVPAVSPKSAGIPARTGNAGIPVHPYWGVMVEPSVGGSQWALKQPLGIFSLFQIDLKLKELESSMSVVSKNGLVCYLTPIISQKINIWSLWISHLTKYPQNPGNIYLINECIRVHPKIGSEILQKVFKHAHYPTKCCRVNKLLCGSVYNWIKMVFWD